MACYTIEWKSSATKELRRLDRQVVPRIVAAVSALASQPMPTGCAMLKGSDYTYRIRVGDYRIIYEIFETHLVVAIVRVRHRKDAYR